MNAKSIFLWGGAAALWVIAGGALWYVHGADTAPAPAETAAVANTVQAPVPVATTTAPAPAEVVKTVTNPSTPSTPITKTTSVSYGGAGSIVSVAVSVGQSVAYGQTLFTVKPTGMDAPLAQAQSDLAAAQAKLKTLQSTTTAKVSSADQAALTNAQAAVRTAIKNAYFAASNVVTNQAAQFFTNPTTGSAKFNIVIANSQTAINLGNNITVLENLFPSWQKAVLASSFNSATNTATRASQAQSILNQIPDFLVMLSSAISSGLNMSHSSIVSDVTTLTNAEIAVSNAQAAITTAENAEVEARAQIAADSKSTSSSPSAIAAQQALISSLEAQVKTLTSESATATVKAPIAGVVSKIGVGLASSISASTILATITTKEE